MTAKWLTIRVGLTNEKDAEISTHDAHNGLRAWMFEKSSESPIEIADTLWGVHMVELVDDSE